MTGFIRRKFYLRAAPPPADQFNIGEGELQHEPGWPDAAWPDATWAEFDTINMVALTAAADAGQGFFCGWGEGDADWDYAPDDVAGGAFVALLGLLRATWQYVTPNPAGALATASGARFDASVSPTRRILLDAAYDGTNEPDAFIREIGIYMNAEPDVGHEGQSYLPLADLANTGDLKAADRILMVERLPEISGAVRVVLRVGDV